MDSKRSKNEELWPLEDEQLPVELQWENMEAGILQKMEELQSATKPDDKKRRRRWLLFCFVLIAGGLISAVLFNNRPTSDSSKLTDLDAIQASETSHDRPATERCKEEGNPVLNKGLQTSTNSVAKEEQQYQGSGKERDLLEAETSHPALGGISPAQAQLTSAPKKDLPSNDSSIASYRSTNEIEASNHISPRNGHQPKEGPISTTKVGASVIVELLSPNGIISPVAPPYLILRPDLPTIELTVDKLDDTSTVTRNTLSGQLWLGSGVSWWNPGYGNSSPERADFEQAALSYQGQLSYVQPLKRGFILHLGISYQQLNSRFNWSVEIPDYEIVLEDTVVQIQRNVFTGAQTEIRGNLSVRVPAERRVEHYNSIRLLQIPVSIGKSWGKDKWQSHILVGGFFNIPLSVTGRTLYQGEVVDYDDTSTAIWSNKLGFGASLSTGLNYQLTDKLGLMTTLQFQQNLTNWSAEPGVTIRPSILNWSLGARYSL